LKKSQAIAIFDSGIGGLTVAKAINQLLPNEQLIYFGDTAHLPYGDKSAENIQYFSQRIAEFLLEKECKCIVIACNTASSVAFEKVLEIVNGKIPVFNVIDPVVAFISENNNYKKIGVIGTKGTIKSNIYERKIAENLPHLEVVSLATPLLAPMIEEGFFNNSISKTIIKNYLCYPDFSDIDAIVLACTHYPLIKEDVNDFFNSKVNILDTANIVAQFVMNKLSEIKILTDDYQPKQHHFYVSDYTDSFQQSAKIFFKEKINLEKANIWI